VFSVWSLSVDWNFILKFLFQSYQTISQTLFISQTFLSLPKFDSYRNLKRNVKTFKNSHLDWQTDKQTFYHTTTHNTFFNVTISFVVSCCTRRLKNTIFWELVQAVFISQPRSFFVSVFSWPLTPSPWCVCWQLCFPCC
jgi:hypothetical protein